MPKVGYRSTDDIENTAGVLCEQYLPGIYRYIHHWMDNDNLAEELTLKVLKETLARYGDVCQDEKQFSMILIAGARNEVLDCLEMDSLRPRLSGLSFQEQDVISLRFGALLGHRMISKLTGISESKVSAIVSQALGKMRVHTEVPA